MPADNRQEKIYNLKAVVRETGVNPETLRAWERRYGFPQPDRSDGGHRRYSIYDITLIRWLNARIEEGMSISSAVDLYQSLSAEGRDPIIQNDPLPLSRTSRHDVSKETNQPLSLENLREAWITACLAFDEPAAEQTLSLAFALYPAEDVSLQLISAGLQEIGSGWYDQDISIQQEHFATAQAMRKLDALIAATPGNIRPERIIIASPSGETHEFPLLLLTFLLKRKGFSVIYLGANVPNQRLIETIRQVRPQVVVSSAQLLQTAATLRDMALTLAREGVVTAFGGGIFIRNPVLVSRIPGYYLGNSLSEAPDRIMEFLAGNQEIINPSPISKMSQEALTHFRHQLPFIEAEVSRRMIADDMDYRHLQSANGHIGRDILAALTLDEISHLGNEISWVEGLLVNYGIPDDVLRNYMAVYLEVARALLDERGLPIINWLAATIAAWH